MLVAVALLGREERDSGEGRQEGLSGHCLADFLLCRVKTDIS